MSIEVSNDRVEDDLNSRVEFGREEHKSLNEEWIEVRVQGKLPERRSNHTSWIYGSGASEYLYIHGGRDLKEGPVATLWRVNISLIHRMMVSPDQKVEWEQVNTTGKDTPGKISHSSAIVCGSNVVIYGG